jgi:hypothetical protein
VCDQHRSQLDEVAVRRIFDLDDSPRILPTSNLLAVNLDHRVGAHDREGDGLAKLLNLLLVVFILITKQKAKNMII